DSPNFPTAHPLQPVRDEIDGVSPNAFISKVNASGSALVYSTYFGNAVNTNQPDITSAERQGLGIAVDGAGNAHIVGTTGSRTFPTRNPIEPFLLGGGSEAFVGKISATPSDVSIFPLHTDFLRPQPVGVASDPQISILSNASNATLTITSINVTGANRSDFSQTNNCGTSVPAHTSCSISVTFTPTATGNRSGTVSIVDSSPAQAISLTGVGLLFTVTKVSSSRNPSGPGDAVTLNATVSSPSGGTPTGTVYFNQGDNSLANKTLVDGRTSFTTRALPIGQDVVTANYSGDSNYGFSGATLTERVLEANTTTVLTSSPNPSFVGQAVKFIATITSSSGTPPDGEPINFSNDLKTYATAPLKAGKASIEISSIPAGAPTIKATYPGDNTFDTSSASIKQVVNRYATSTRVTSNANPSPLAATV